MGFNKFQYVIPTMYTMIASDMAIMIVILNDTDIIVHIYFKFHDTRLPALIVARPIHLTRRQGAWPQPASSRHPLAGLKVY